MHITLLYLFNYCIYRFYEILYALINLTKAKTQTKTKIKKNEINDVKIILTKIYIIYRTNVCIKYIIYRINVCIKTLHCLLSKFI